MTRRSSRRRAGQEKEATGGCWHLPSRNRKSMDERTFPYRSWCRHCIFARASNPAHWDPKFATAAEDDNGVKQVSCNYCFMRDCQVKILVF